MSEYCDCYLDPSKLVDLDLMSPMIHSACKKVIKQLHDPVSKPSHYNAGKIEVIAFIEDQKLGYHLGNVLKYVCRAPHKGEELQDLQKARFYLDRFITLLEEKVNAKGA